MTSADASHSLAHQGIPSHAERSGVGRGTSLLTEVRKTFSMSRSDQSCVHCYSGIRLIVQAAVGSSPDFRVCVCVWAEGFCFPPLMEKKTHPKVILCCFFLRTLELRFSTFLARILLGSLRQHMHTTIRTEWSFCQIVLRLHCSVYLMKISPFCEMDVWIRTRKAY